MKETLPLSGVSHDGRLIPMIVDDLAQNDGLSTWASVPVDEQDVSKGYRDIDYKQFANAVNHAAHWLERNLPASSDRFQRFAYAGSRDLRYPILAMAAGKLHKVMVVPSPFITADAQLHILSRTACSVYIRTSDMAAKVDPLATSHQGLRLIEAPRLEDLLQDAPAKPIVITRSWEDAKTDPWLVFHTSGTTGNPKPITYTHQMMAIPDHIASIRDISETHIHYYARKRWYTPMPMLHFVGMLMACSMTTCLRMVLVLGPASAPMTTDVVRSVLKHASVDGAILVPTTINELSQEEEGLGLLQSLGSIHYVGAPLSENLGRRLSSHVKVVPSIGSTETGGYFTKVRDGNTDFSYVEFQPQAGATFEPRSDDLHELVFVRIPGSVAQSIFLLYPDRDRYATGDLWEEHPDRKDLWKLVGRTDDYVYLDSGAGLHASTLEAELLRHESVNAALIGGHARSKPIAIIELVPSAQNQLLIDHSRLLQSLSPYVDAANAKCHSSVRLTMDGILFCKDKPLTRTAKGSIARAQSLKQFESEIHAMFSS